MPGVSHSGSNRRAFLAAATAAVASAAVRAPASGETSRVPFGAAVNHYKMPEDAAYRAAIARHCDVVVAEGAMKWAEIRPRRETFNFEQGDGLVAFARQNGLTVRGHTLVWCEGNPDWLKTLVSVTEAERLLVDHIERTVSHYAGSIASWDIVNEPIAEKPVSAAHLRSGVWQDLLGPAYIDLAFKTAHRVAPSQQRVLNEYGIEAATRQDSAKRAAFRRLILDLKSRDVPITAVGLQGHLNGALEIDTDGVAKFCSEMASIGLDVLVTELDVNDQMLPADEGERDRIVAKRVDDFLGAVFSACRPALLCTWGITDRYTWMPTWFKRADGKPNRPLPLDADLKPKPVLSVINKYCRSSRGETP